MADTVTRVVVGRHGLLRPDGGARRFRTRAQSGDGAGERRARVTALAALALIIVLGGCGEPPRPTVNLYRAVHIGDLDQIKRHLFWKTEINRPGPDGSYPIHVAVSNGRVAIAKELLRHGARTDVRDRLGRTPLHVALANGKVPSATLLMSAGAEDELQPLLFELVREGNADRDTLELLTRHGADVNATDPDGATPLHLAIANSDVRLAKRLISVGADVNQTDAKGRTPLTRAKALDDPFNAEILSGLLEQYGAVQ